MDQEKKKERPQLGLAIPVTNKQKSSSYDLKGNIMIDHIDLAHTKLKLKEMEN